MSGSEGQSAGLCSPSAAGLAVRDLAVRYPSRRQGLLAGASLELAPGEIVGLRGRSGSGKTTLLGAVNGLVPWLAPAIVEGTVELDGASLEELDPGQRAPLLGSCLERAETQLFLATPRHELDAAARLHGRVGLASDLVEILGVGSLLDRRTTELSSGERQRVALAVALTATPCPLLLDEPTAHLDADGVAALAGALRRATDLGGSALVADQAGWRLDGAIGRWLEVRERRLAGADRPVAPSCARPAHAPSDEVVLEVRGLQLERSGKRLGGPLDLVVRRGEVVLVSGPNGVGKSTLARRLASPGRGGGGLRRRGRVGLMLPDSTIQLLQPTVLAELATLCGDRGAVARVLHRHRLEALAARTPWSLSRGERQRLVHAALDVTRPDLLIIDEPAQGLDPEDVAVLVDLIHERARRGRAYLLISHREELVPAAHRRLLLDGGRLEEMTP